MDDLTHVLAGALIAQTIPSKKKGLVLACVLGAVAPDFDVVLSIFNHELYVMEHRGFTHSLLGMLPMVLLASSLAWLFVRKKSDGAPFLALFGMALAGDVSHLALDWCTSWGTMLLWPNRTRYALDQLFIFDIWYLILLVVPLILCARFPAKRVAISLVGIVLLLSYHGLTVGEHRLALQVGAEIHPDSQSIALPEPLSPFRWTIFTRRLSQLQTAHIDFLKNSTPLTWQIWDEPPYTPEIQEAFATPRVKTFLWFARAPMWEEKKNSDGSILVRFWDGRFNATFGALGKSNTHRFGANVLIRNGKVETDQAKDE